MKALAINTARAEAGDCDDADENDINSTPGFSDRQAAALQCCGYCAAALPDAFLNCAACNSIHLPQYTDDFGVTSALCLFFLRGKLPHCDALLEKAGKLVLCVMPQACGRKWVFTSEGTLATWSAAISECPSKECCIQSPFPVPHSEYCTLGVLVWLKANLGWLLLCSVKGRAMTSMQETCDGILQYLEHVQQEEEGASDKLTGMRELPEQPLVLAGTRCMGR